MARFVLGGGSSSDVLIRGCAIYDIVPYVDDLGPAITVRASVLA